MPSNSLVLRGRTKACIPSCAGDPMVRKKTLSELDQAEIKLQSLLEKRDALNQEAALLRQERDLVHETKREIGAKLRGLKDRRASFAGEARKHREKRDELQAKAKALIEMKRKLRGSGHADVGAELRALKRRVTAMEMRQQTASLTLSAENELLGELKDSMKRAKRSEAREARTLLRQQNRAVRDALLDEKKLEASADAALKALLEKGKVEIGR